MPRRSIDSLNLGDHRKKNHFSFFVFYSCCSVMKLVHGFFFFSEESLKGEFFFPFFASVRIEGFDFFVFHRVYRVISGIRPS